MSESDQLSELLYEAHRLRPRERERLLSDVESHDPELGVELRSLLAFADDPDDAFRETGGDIRHGEAVDWEIPGYRIVRRLGHGGLGEVFEAVKLGRVPQRVAIKRIKHGLDTQSVLRRFRNEERALARLAHPNICRALDAGRDAAGRPFIVLEHSDGPAITEYAQTHALSTKQRIELVMQACDGIQHAHAQGFLHRDIKPSNLLVPTEGSEPKVKVIDFGMAAIMDPADQDLGSFERTSSGEQNALVGTIGYMSPEQAAGEAIDEQADVYALGVVLYNLLAGADPHDRQLLRALSRDQLVRHLRNSIPVPPSTLASRNSSSSGGGKFDRELDWICLAAMRSELPMRYKNIAGFRQDLDNYLNGRPVWAADHTVVYRLRKHLTQNRIVYGITSTVVGISVLVMGILLVAYARVSDARDAAVSALEDTSAAVEYLGSIVLDASPYRLGPDTPFRDVLLEATVRLDVDLANHPRVLADMERAVGKAHMSIGDFRRAEELLERALERTQRVFGPTSVEFGRVLLSLAILSERTDDKNLMREYALRAAQVFREVPVPHPEQLLEARAVAADALVPDLDLKAGTTELELLHREAVAAGLGISDIGIRVALWYADALRWSRRVQEAGGVLDGVANSINASSSNVSWELDARLHRERGALHLAVGRAADAVPFLARARDILNEHLGPGSTRVLSLRADLAFAMYQQGDQADGADELGRVLREYEGTPVHGSKHVLTLSANWLAMLNGLERDSEILEHAPQLVTSGSRLLGADSMVVAQVRGILGSTMLRRAEFKEAAVHLESAKLFFERKSLTHLPVYSAIEADLRTAKEALAGLSE